jgi:hypothetical protein
MTSISKAFLLCLLLVTPLVLPAQTLKQKLQGEWLCYEVTDAKGLRIDTDAYLRIVFEGSNSFVSDSPIDRGNHESIKYTESGVNFFLADGGVQNYSVAFLSPDSLELTMTDESGATVTSRFVNQRSIKDLSALQPERRVYNFTLVIFARHSEFNRLRQIGAYTSVFTNDLYESIKKSVNSFLPPPNFKREEGKNFVTFFNYEFKLDKATGIDSVNNKLIIDFDVTSKGIENPVIVEKINYVIGSHIFSILEKSGKYWELPKYRELPERLPIRMIFEIIGGPKDGFNVPRN